MSAEETPSPAVGACVLVVLGGAAAAAAFAIDEALGALGVMAVGWFALWRSARRMSDSSATPPPASELPSGDEPAVQELADGTTLVHRKGMLIYRKPDPRNPQRTAVRVEQTPETEH